MLHIDSRQDRPVWTSFYRHQAKSTIGNGTVVDVAIENYLLENKMLDRGSTIEWE
jgi:hypothetical protein